MLLYMLIYCNESIVKVMFKWAIVCYFLVLTYTLLVRNAYFNLNKICSIIQEYTYNF